MLSFRQKMFVGLAGALLSAGAADACTPGDPYKSMNLQRGDNCSVTYPQGDYDSVDLYEASDLGKGFVFQSASVSGVCYSERMTVIHDCNTGEVGVFGGVELAWGHSAEQDEYNENNPLIHLDELIQRKSKSGTPLSLENISQRATRAKLPVNSIMNLRNKIRIDGQRVDTRCGCKMFYPDLMEKT